MTTDEASQHDMISALRALAAAPGAPELSDPYDAMIAELRVFLDALAGASVTVSEAERVREQLSSWNRLLLSQQVGESDRLWGHWMERAGRGQALVPVYAGEHVEGELSAKVVFGRLHVGENMAVHGGAVSLLFDDALGWLMIRSGLPPSRTAYLTTNFRSVTPVGVELTLRGRVDRIEGRKRFLTGEIRHGDTLCAEAEGLWVELRPGQR